MENELEGQKDVFQDNEPVVEEVPVAEPVASQPDLPRVEETSEPVQQEKKAAKPKKVKKPKKCGVLKKIVSVLLIIALAAGCSLTGGYVGAKYMEQMMAQDSEDDMEKLPTRDEETPGKNDGDTDVLEGDRESTVIDVNKIDTSKLMSAAEVYALNVNSTVGITTSITTNYWGYTTTSAASGSGFIYSDDGYIITNYHVVEDSSAISVSFYDGSSLNAKLVGYDESNDVAVLKVEPKTELTPVIIGDSSNLNVGDPVVAIGNPLGELTFSLTSGAVSALNREVTFSGGVTMNLIQTDCAINSGNSGGAMFNLYGEVIGITNAKYSGNSSSGASIDNIGFAIPMNQVRAIIDSIIENGYVIKPYIGVSIEDVSEKSQNYGLPSGASVLGVVEGSPAEAAGLQINDIVTHINGQKIDSAADLKRIVSNSKPGDTLELRVWRTLEMGVWETVELTLIVGEQTQENEVQQSQQSQQSQQGQQGQQGQQIPGYPNFGWGY